MKICHALLALAIVGFAVEARAQAPALKAPDASPAATVTQMVGLTEMKVVYHRPAVHGRKIWGELVPYGEVWRAGANENTVISFSSPVKIGGKKLAAGTYGLYMLPTAKDWTVIFSTQAGLWGSQGYDIKEDAVRVATTPSPAELEERLAYSFDEPAENGVTLALRWEKLRVPVKIEVDTAQVVMTSMRAELRGVASYNWASWNDAAQYWLDHGGSLDEAFKLSDKSVGLAENFYNLFTRATLLAKKGDAKTAAELRARALNLASEPELNDYGYRLLRQKQLDDALVVFQKNAQVRPTSANALDSLAEAYLAKGNKAAAIDSYQKALALAKDARSRKRIESTLARLKTP